MTSVIVFPLHPKGKIFLKRLRAGLFGKANQCPVATLQKSLFVAQFN